MTDLLNPPTYMVNLDSIRTYIRALMAEKRVTVAKLAEITGIAKGTLDNFFDGSTKAPTFDKVCTIIVKLGGSVDEALGISRQPRPAEPQTDLSHLLTAHRETIEAKNETIAGLRDSLATSRDLYASLAHTQRISALVCVGLIALSIILAFV